MGDHYDDVALGGVKGEVNDTLAQVRQSLQAYIKSVSSGGQNDTHLRFCLNAIRQLHGTLTVAEFYGAALLADEMGALIRALLDGTVQRRGESFEVLRQSIRQIPPYFEPVYQGRRDLPSGGMSMLNALREARGERVSSNISLLKPSMGKPASAVIGSQFTAPKTLKLPIFLKRLHKMYQMALVGYIKGRKQEENLTYMLKVSERMTSLFDGTPAGVLWPVLSALIESLLLGGCKNTLTVRNLLRQVDTEMSHLEGDITAGNRSISDDFLKNMLYCVACSTSEGSLTEAVKTQYRLGNARPDGKPVLHEPPSVLKSGNEAMPLAIKTVLGELLSVKDVLDQCVLRPSHYQGLVNAQLPILGHVADIMNTLGLGLLREVVQDQIDTLRRMVNEEIYNANLLINVAGSLLYVEATLAGMAWEKPTAVRDIVMPETDIISIHQTVIQAAGKGLKQTKDAMVDYVASQWNITCLASVPATLAMVRSGLAMIPLERATMQVSAALHYVEHELLSGRTEPTWQALDTLVNVIVGVEHYLERLRYDRQSRGDVIMDGIDRNLSQLGYRPEIAAPKKTTETAMLAEDAQEEIVSFEAIEDVLSSDEIVKDTVPVIDNEATNKTTTEPSDTDVDRLNIFRKEAILHLQIINSFVVESNERQAALTTVSDALQGSLQALTRGAEMAGITPVAEVVRPLEKMIKVFGIYNIAVDEKVLTLLNRGSLLIQDGLDQMDSSPMLPLAGANELLNEIHLLQSKRLVDADASEPAPKGNHEKKAEALFLAEGVDLLLEANAILTHWNYQEAPEAAQSLLDTLIMVSDSAKRVGIVPLGELADGVSALYRCLLQRQLSMNDGLMQLLRDSHGHLIGMMDQLVARKELISSSELLDRIEVLLRDSRVPSGDKRADDFSKEASDRSTAESSTADNMDQELIALFLDEATYILEEASRDLSRWLEYPDDKTCLQTLKRHLHTLKSSAKMAGVTVISDLGHALEYLYGDICESRLSASQELLNLLLRTHDTLDEMLSQLRSNNVCRSAEDLCAIIREFRGCDTDEVSEQEDGENKGQVSFTLPEGLNPAMAGIFLDEANDLLELIEEQMAAWQSDTANRLPAEELMRALQILKSNAGMAGLTELGDSSHQVEVVVEGLQQKEEVSHAELRELASDVERLQRIIEGISSVVGQMTESQPSELESAPQEAKEAVEADQQIADVLSFPQQDERKKFSVNAPAFLHAAQTSGAAVDVSAREVVRVPVALLDQLVNLAGETSIGRARIEQQISDSGYTLQKMHDTIERLRGQLRRLDIETKPQSQLSCSLAESVTDLMDFNDALVDRNREFSTLVTQQGRINTELQEGLVRTRRASFSRLLPRLRRMSRQVSYELGKDVEFSVENAEGEMDLSIMARMLMPLEHLLRNAVDHGIESTKDRIAQGKPSSGQIRLVFGREGGEFVIKLSDDGKGLNPEVIRQKAQAHGLLASGVEMNDADVIRIILEPGFSTTEKATQISGRGVGLAAVNSELKQLGGRLNIHSAQGEGTTFEIRLPSTLSIKRALMVYLGEELYAVPLNAIEGIVRVSPADLRSGYDSGQFDYADRTYRFHYLGEMFNKAKPSLEQVTKNVPVLLMHSGEIRVALQIDDLSANREVAVKSAGAQFADLPGVASATILGDGRVVAMLDGVAQALKQRVQVTSADQQRDAATRVESNAEQG